MNGSCFVGVKKKAILIRLADDEYYQLYQMAKQQAKATKQSVNSLLVGILKQVLPTLSVEAFASYFSVIITKSFEKALNHKLAGLYHNNHFLTNQIIQIQLKLNYLLNKADGLQSLGFDDIKTPAVFEELFDNIQAKK